MAGAKGKRQPVRKFKGGSVKLSLNQKEIGKLPADVGKQWGEKVRIYAKRRARYYVDNRILNVQSGALRDGFQTRTEVDKKTWNLIIFNREPYAAYQEFGTRGGRDGFSGGNTTPKRFMTAAFKDTYDKYVKS